MTWSLNQKPIFFFFWYSRCGERERERASLVILVIHTFGKVRKIDLVVTLAGIMICKDLIVNKLDSKRIRDNDDDSLDLALGF